MQTNFRKLLTAAMLFLVLAFSAVMTMPVSADEPTPETPTAEETADLPEQDAEEEEAVQTQTEPAPASEESAPAETVETILESIPQDTELIVVDEAGETVPLVTEEAADAIMEGDPIWCPVGVTPNAGVGGCSPNFAVFGSVLGDPNNELLAWMAANDKKVAGVIWIAYNYASGPEPTVNDNVTINGLDLTNFSTVALTLQGGWNGVNGSNALNSTTPYSTFNASLSILNWNAPVTISDVTVTGNFFGAYSLRITTTGNITATRVNVSDNFFGGASFENNVGASTGNITISDSTFNNNTNASSGLRVRSNGAITIKNVTANGNFDGVGGLGIDIDNQSAATAKAVTLSNITVSGNQRSGLMVLSNGAITVTDITAVGNGQGVFSNGAALWNDVVGYASPVTMNGTNLIFSTTGYGLHIKSNGAVKLNSVHAVNNTWYGAYIKNDTAVTPQPVTLTGTSTFKFNGFRGLEILTLGQITGNNITASSNTQQGAVFNNSGEGATGGVTLTGTNIFNTNGNTGLRILSVGQVTLNALTANQNGTGGPGHGVSIDNHFESSVKGVTLTGFNIFNENKNQGLDIRSGGIVTLNNITANENDGNYGVFIDNRDSTPAAPKAVTINGINTVNNNMSYGLYVNTYGAITINSLTANGNGIGASNGYGAYLDNDHNDTITPANITLTGTNTFNGNYTGGLVAVSWGGVIKANNLTANNTVDVNGAYLQNSAGAAGGSVILTGVNTFTGNKTSNLVIYSKGSIILSNVTAGNSVSGAGASIINTDAATPKPITLTGTNIFNNNWFNGVEIYSKGVITVNNLTASNNGISGSGGGAFLNNSGVGASGGVTLTGTNAFNNNASTGLTVYSLGNIKGNNITASGGINASALGAELTNTFLNSVGGVTLTGTNTFVGNSNTNLQVASVGAISISNLTANGSLDWYGAYLSNTTSGALNPKPVTLTGSNVFNNNSRHGLYILTYGAITTNNLTANGNGAGPFTGLGALLDNSSGSIPMGVTLNGTNTFVGNKSNNLQVVSLGAIKANNITASGSLTQWGAVFDNSSPNAVGNVTLTGVNTFNNNLGRGLTINSSGSVALSNVTANNNGTWGIDLVNTFSTFAAPKPVIFSGYATANGNGGRGIAISTYGAVTMSNVTANSNGDYGAAIDNHHFDSVTPANVTLGGVNSFNGNGSGIVITSFGNVLLNNITASLNGSIGADINTSYVGATGAVTLTGKNAFIGNVGSGLSIQAAGTVSINNVTASGQTGGGSFGASITNTFAGASAPKPVKLTGVNVFNNNAGNGLIINTYGAITISNLTANANSGIGAQLTNNAADTPANVTLTGTNQFSGNGSSGLLVTSKGVISVNNLTASGNGSYGASLDNSSGAAAVNVTGANFFNGNVNHGLRIISNGAVTLTKITADGSTVGGVGLYVETQGNVNLTCGSFTNNSSVGVYINLPSPFVATLKGIVFAGNISGDTNFPGSGTIVQTHGCPLP
jgi:hypothetical protein